MKAFLFPLILGILQAVRIKQNYIELESFDEFEAEELSLLKTDQEKYISKKTPVIAGGNFTVPWNQLTEKEKNYAYYLSEASWAGAKMVLHQISYEGPALFLMFHAFFQDKNHDELKRYVVNDLTITADDYKAFLAYAAAFYQNMGNYRSFGSMKFIPEMSPTKFLTILKTNPLYLRQNTEKGQQYKKLIDELYTQVEEEIFNINKPFKQLGYPSDGGVTAYFGNNMSK